MECSRNVSFALFGELFSVFMRVNALLSRSSPSICGARTAQCIVEKQGKFAENCLYTGLHQF